MPSREPSLKERAYIEIKQRIQDMTFAAGDFLSERRLASMLGMSKTPIKAALERLEHEGFVAVAPQQGIVVRSPSMRDVQEMLELRRALESFCFRAVAGKL